MTLTALNGMERIVQHQETFGASSVEISSARNEVESFQIVVSAPKENITVTKAEITDLAGPNGAKIDQNSIRLFR